MIVLSVLATSIFAGETHVIDDLWFDLADRYKGEAIVAIEKDGKPEDWKRIEFFIGEDALSMRSYRFEADGSETLFDERFGNLAGSILLYHDMRGANLSTRFSDTRTDAAEASISPISILRLIEHRREEIGLHIVDRHDDGTVTVGFSLTVNGHTEEHEFDVLDRKITEYRSVKRNGRFINTIQYDEWQEIESGQPIPTSIVSEINAGEEKITEYITIKSAELVQPHQAPTSPRIPNDYTVVDYRQQAQPPASAASSDQTDRAPRRQSRITSRAVSSALVAIGILIVLASIILMVIRARR